MGWEGNAERIESREEWGESKSESRFDIGLEMGEKRSVRGGEETLIVGEAVVGRVDSTLSLSERVGLSGAGVKSMNWSKCEKSPDPLWLSDPVLVRACRFMVRRNPALLEEEEEEGDDEGEYDNSGSSLDASLLPPPFIPADQVLRNEILRCPFDVVMIPPSESSLQ